MHNMRYALDIRVKLTLVGALVLVFYYMCTGPYSSLFYKVVFELHTTPEDIDDKLPPKDLPMYYDSQRNCSYIREECHQGCDINVVDVNTEKFLSWPCEGPSCLLNSKRPPVHYNTKSKSTCTNVMECVTIVVKSRHRETLVKQLLKSIVQFYSGIRIIITDEIINTNSDKRFRGEDLIVNWRDFLYISPNVTYIQTQPGMGIGRNIGAGMVKTKYALFLDDDYVFIQRTDLSKLLQILERTDIGIVGVTTSPDNRLNGIYRSLKTSNTNGLIHYRQVFYDYVPCFSYCYMTDVIGNIFLANVDTVMKAGGWDNRNIVSEDQPFFLQMRRAAVKVARCYDVRALHDKMDRRLQNTRGKQTSQTFKNTFKTWNVTDLYLCNEMKTTHGTPDEHLDQCFRISRDTL